ncbi:MAG TPA: flippase activity-associated protein Agl23 [Candidatus Udaeobacter sp.]|nr:flippase activity-associated protein Agl23 [Candidatus Udaeobacter sp.]
MAARTSSAEQSAPAEYSSAIAGLRNGLDHWKAQLAQMDWVPWAILGLAAFLRFLLLGMKPPHFDEGINGWFVDQVVHNGFYRYDPTNYHGPLHFYVLLLFECLFGRNLWALRLPVVLVSMVCVWLVLKFEPLVGRNVSRIAALAMAISPAFVFYGRYAIHEVWLQLFSTMFILGLLGLWKLGRLNYLWYAGMGLAGMILTKETYAIHLACAILAIPTLAVSIVLSKVHQYLKNDLKMIQGIGDGKRGKRQAVKPPKRRWTYMIRTLMREAVNDLKPAKQAWTYIDFAMVIIVGAATIIFFYSGTFFNWNGVKGLYLAFKAWTETGAAGHGHEKAWDYWLKLMGPLPDVGGNDSPIQRLRHGRADAFGYELPMLAGLILCLFCQKFKNLSLRYLAIYGAGSLVAYSYVKYKTPWCIVSFGWPFLFIFGGLILLVRPKHLRIAYRAVAVLLCLSLGSSIWLNYFRCSSPDEPYAYVQTYNDIFKLSRPLLKLARRDPVYYHLIGHLIRSSVYPLPWVLGDFDRVGYYEGGNMPGNLDGDFLLVQQDKIQDVESKLKGSYYTDTLTLRNYQDPSKLYLSAKVFKEFFPNKAPDFVGKTPGG